MSLSDLQIRQIKAVAKPKKLFDDGGLYLHCTLGGGKMWRFKFRFAGAIPLNWHPCQRRKTPDSGSTFSRLKTTVLPSA